MKKVFYLLLLLLLFVLPTGALLAAEEGFQISMSRDFGYGGFGNQIQGLFSLKVNGDEVFEKVVFMMDEIVLGEDDEAPYKIQFSTDDYEPGEHEYWARGIQADGSEVNSNRITALVLSKEETRNSMQKIFGVVIGGIALTAFLSVFLTNRISKRANKSQTFEANGIPSGFTARGGSICPKCGEPFSFHWWKMNLLTHKLDRCPNCGKWVLAKSMSYSMLESVVLAAKKEGKGEEKVVSEKQETDELRRKLDDSKFMDN